MNILETPGIPYYVPTSCVLFHTPIFLLLLIMQSRWLRSYAMFSTRHVVRFSSFSWLYLQKSLMIFFSKGEASVPPITIFNKHGVSFLTIYAWTKCKLYCDYLAKDCFLGNKIIIRDGFSPTRAFILRKHETCYIGCISSLKLLLYKVCGKSRCHVNIDLTFATPFALPTEASYVLILASTKTK